LEAQVLQFQKELTRLPGRNIISKAKVPEPSIFAGSENKMYLYNWLSQIALYYLAFEIIVDN